MSAKTGAGRKPDPEARSLPLALLLTILLWAAGAAALVLLPPPQSDGGAERALYQSISLQLAPWDGGREDGKAGVVSEAAGAVGTVPPPPAAVPATVPASSSAAVRKAAPSISEPAPDSSSNESLAGPAPDRPLDPATLDADEWEALFAQGDGRSYRSSSQAAAEGGRSAAPGPLSSLSGIAATAGAGDAGAAASSTADGHSQADGPTAGTSAAVAGIARAALTAGEAGSEDGEGGKPGRGTDMELAGGGIRRLLEPAQPVIRISEGSRRYIPGSLEVTISLAVSPEGLVLPGSIKITPESLIHPEVQGEIRTQIGKWRFQSAEGSGQVSFKYNIIKK